MSTKDAARGLAVDVVIQWFTRSCGAMKEWEKWREVWEEQLTEQFAQILRTERRKVWEEAAVDLSHGLPAIWKKALIDRCLFKAEQAANETLTSYVQAERAKVYDLVADKMKALNDDPNGDDGQDWFLLYDWCREQAAKEAQCDLG